MCEKKNEDRNILVVDDELMNIKMVERIFKDVSAVHIIKAMNSAETFAALERESIALILLDLKMPEVDGFELFRRIREKYDMPVMLMTADNSEETLRMINELGIDGHLTKPLNKSITQEMVCGIINYRRDDP